MVDACRFPLGGGYVKEMIVTELKPFEPVKWKCMRSADEWVDTNISFELRAGDKNSFLLYQSEMLGQIEQQEGNILILLIFRHEGWKKESLKLLNVVIHGDDF